MPLSKEKIKKLQFLAKWVRKMILEMGISAGFGHIAPSFSCVEILICLYYGGILRVKPSNPEWDERDRFLLSKGHAAMALYPILSDLGFFPLSELKGFCREKSRLGAHAESNIPGIDISTGSLGHGLSIGAGLALSAKMDKRRFFSFVLMGDGECNEGSVWEAAMFASHHCLNNLIAIIDRNRLCATDFLESCLDVEPLDKKWESFGWEVAIVNGHSFEELFSVLEKARFRKSAAPLVIIASTTKGKGLPYMESNPIWHYRIPQDKELEIAKKKLLYVEGKRIKMNMPSALLRKKNE